MARIIQDDQGLTASSGEQNIKIIESNGQETVAVTGSEFITDATLSKDGHDLVLEAPDGSVVIIEGYFLAEPAPTILSPDGNALTPSLVNSFLSSSMQYAQTGSMNDASPVGAVDEISGQATVTRADGTVEDITIGTPIYQGDVIETEGTGAVNILFIDETSFAVSENARFSIDDYTYDPATEIGTQNFSVLRGVFVFTSGLIGRDDPDDVNIDTPVGSIGIRGTIIAGNIAPDGGPSEITVIEGAIVVRNGLSEATLSNQFETVQLDGFNSDIQNIGSLDAQSVNTKFASVSPVAPNLFSSINDVAQEQNLENSGSENTNNEGGVEAGPQQNDGEPAQQEGQQENQNAAPENAQPEQGISDNSPEGSEAQGPNNGNNTPPPSNTNIGGDFDFNPGADNTQTGTNAPGPATSGSGLGSNGPAGSNNSGSTQPPQNNQTTQNSNLTATNPDVIGQTTDDDNQPPALAIQFTGNTISDTAPAGTTVVSLTTTEGFSDAVFTFANGANVSANGYFSIQPAGTGTAKIVLTAAGVAAGLAPSTDFNLGVRVTLTDGRSASKTLFVDVTESNTLDALDLGTLSNTEGFVIRDDINNQIGNTISAVGDINDDGFADFVFSNNTNTTGQNHRYVVFGDGNPVNSDFIANLDTNSQADVIANPTVTDFSNTQVAGIGDFDGDGVEDFAVGTPAADGGKGDVSIISGDDGDVLNVTGFDTGASTGISVSSVGDVNGDGYADVLVGAPGANATSGEAYLIFGGQTETAFNATLDLTTPPSDTALLTYDTGTAGDFFGTEVVGLGDFNGDGLNDFAIGATGQVSGNASVTIYSKNPTTISDQFKITNINTNDGGSYDIPIFNAGDFDGDGFNDIVVASVGDNKAALLFGSTSTNNVDFADIGNTVDGIMIEGGTDQTIVGAGYGGDFNGDGYDDFVVATQNGSEASIYVVYGSDVTNPLTLNISDGDLDDPNKAFLMEYTLPDNNDYDFTISSIGDFNGDGLDDIAIGIPELDDPASSNPPNNDGNIFVVYGQQGGTANYRTDTSDGAADDTIFSNADNQNLIGSKEDDTFVVGDNDTGLSINGGAGADTTQIASTNVEAQFKIDGGSGFDTLHVLSAASAIDFGNLDISRVEEINLTTGGSVQTITLDTATIFKMAGNDSFFFDNGPDTTPGTADDISGYELKITGESGDQVDIDTVEWTDSGADSGGYSVYENSSGTHVLLIDNDIVSSSGVI